jgi:hypothetical protein
VGTEIHPKIAKGGADRNHAKVEERRRAPPLERADPEAVHRRFVRYPFGDCVVAEV